MTASNESNAHPLSGSPSDAPSVPIHLRGAREGDVPTLTNLLLRLKHLNEEFDPLLKVRDDAAEQARRILTEDLTQPHVLLLVVEGVGPDKDRVVGFVRALVRERPFYEPELEGVILDIYLLPLYRRRGVGEYLLRETAAALKAKGAGVVTAEFPAQNEIAVRFYQKRGFRAIIAIEGRVL